MGASGHETREFIICNKRNSAVTTNDAIDPPSTPAAPSAVAAEATDTLSPLPAREPSNDESSTIKEQSASRSSRRCQIPLPSPPRRGLSELLSSPPLIYEGDSYFPSSLSEPQSSFRTVRRIGNAPASPANPRPPRIQNLGGILAPHGTFTSARSRSYTSNTPSQSSSRSSEAPATSRLAMADILRPEEREMLLRAATKGDQLAMYRLGWSSDRRHNRHQLGSARDVWGPGPLESPGTSGTFDSSQSTRTTFSSPAAPATISTDDSRSSIAPEDMAIYRQKPQPRPTVPARVASDLFDDAARLTLSSNAYNSMTRNTPTISHGPTPAGLHEYSRSRRKTKDVKQIKAPKPVT